MTCKSVIRRKYQRISRSLDEKSRRLWCATEALAIKKGGVAMVHAATGVSRPTIYKGIKELESNLFCVECAKPNIQKNQICPYCGEDELGYDNGKLRCLCCKKFINK